MKRWLLVILAALLVFGTLAGCGDDKDKNKESSVPQISDTSFVDSSADSNPEPSDPERVAVQRTLLAWEDYAVYGPLEDVLAAGFERFDLRSAEYSEEAGGTSVSFTFGKPGQGGYLQITGSVFLGTDASALFDLDETEGEKNPDASKANEWLKTMVKTSLEGYGAAPEQMTSGGINWLYGLAEGEDKGTSVLHLYGYGELDKALLYVQLTAADSSAGSMDEIKSDILFWLKSLTGNGKPDEKIQELKVPYSEKGLTASDWDVMHDYGAELRWDAGKQYLDASCQGSKEEYTYYCTFRNAAAAGPEAVGEARKLVASSLESTLGWAYHTEENTLTAWANAGDDVLLFEMSVDPQNGQTADAAFARALDWLKTVKIG
ncbi:MAG: hypothetical protein IJM90_06600 [Firmicutes bacterium]|nr:hypothetical protein [Bacillota bacterium]